MMSLKFAKDLCIIKDPVKEKFLEDNKNNVDK